MALVPVIDISGYQRDLDGAAVAAAGIAGVIVSTGDGSDDNPFGLQQARAAHAAGLGVAAYHFCRPHLDAAEQAAWCVQQAQAWEVPISFVAGDHEAPHADGGPDMVRWIITFQEALGELGVPVHLYTGKPWWNERGLADAARWPLWLASYPHQATDWAAPPIEWADRLAGINPKNHADAWVPDGWTTWTGWQFTSTQAGQVPAGNGANLDLNVYEAACWQEDDDVDPTVKQQINELHSCLVAQGQLDAVFRAVALVPGTESWRKRNMYDFLVAKLGPDDGSGPSIDDAAVEALLGRLMPAIESAAASSPGAADALTVDDVQTALRNVLKTGIGG